MDVLGSYSVGQPLLDYNFQCCINSLLQRGLMEDASYFHQSIVYILHRSQYIVIEVIHITMGCSYKIDFMKKPCHVHGFIITY